MLEQKRILSLLHRHHQPPDHNFEERRCIHETDDVLQANESCSNRKLESPIPIDPQLSTTLDRSVEMKWTMSWRVVHHSEGIGRDWVGIPVCWIHSCQGLFLWVFPRTSHHQGEWIGLEWSTQTAHLDRISSGSSRVSKDTFFLPEKSYWIGEGRVKHTVDFTFNSCGLRRIFLNILSACFFIPKYK